MKTKTYSTESVRQQLMDNIAEDSELSSCFKPTQKVVQQVVKSKQTDAEIRHTKHRLERGDIKGQSERYQRLKVFIEKKGINHKLNWNRFNQNIAKIREKYQIVETQIKELESDYIDFIASFRHKKELMFTSALEEEALYRKKFSFFLLANIANECGMKFTGRKLKFGAITLKPIGDRTYKIVRESE